MNYAQEQLEYNVVYKLYDDKIALSRFTLPDVKWKKIDDEHKVYIPTGEVTTFCYADALRDEKSYMSGLSRTRRAILDLSDRNKFTYFLTITFNGKYVDRNSPEQVHRLYKNVIKRLKYNLGATSYIAVSEFHKDNDGIHYHIMINFIRPLKLRFKGYSVKGQIIYHLHENERTFKVEDCFLVFEKLDKNNPHYLIKYMTKGKETPLKRRYSTSRGLKRAVILDKVYMQNCRFMTAKDCAKAYGFEQIFKNSRTDTVRYTQARASAPVDLSNTGTKDETLESIYYSLLEKFEKVGKIKRKIGLLATAPPVKREQIHMKELFS